MKTLRDSKFLAVFGALAVMLAISLAAAPSADAGCYGHGGFYSSYYAPATYVAPVYPTYKYVAPVYPTYYTPTYFNYGCHYPW